MSRYAGMRKALAAALATATVLCLAGCSNNGSGDDRDVDIDLVGDLSYQDTAPTVTTTTAVSKEIVTVVPAKSASYRMWCDIAPYEENETFEYFCGKGEYEPGYIYYELEKFGSSAKPYVLLEKKFKDAYETCHQTDTMMYAVSLEDEVVEVDKRDGSYRVLYTAQYGSVDILTCSDRAGDEEARLVYVNDGGYIVQIDKNTGEYTLPVYSENGISELYCQGTFLHVATCQYCVYDKDYIVWADGDGNWFWYHPEVDKNEPLVQKENSLEKADPSWTIGEEVEFSYPSLDGRTGGVEIGCIYEDALGYRWYGMEPGYLYFDQGVYDNIQPYLLLAKRFDDRKNIYQNNEYVYAVSEDKELCKVNKRDGTYEVLCRGVTDFRPTAVPGFIEQAEYMLYSDGKSVIRMDVRTDSTETVVSSDNGVVRIIYYGWERLDWEESEFGSNAFDFSLACEECKYSQEYFMWEDGGGNYYWYHPERGESEPLDYNALTNGGNY